MKAKDKLIAEKSRVGKDNGQVFDNLLIGISQLAKSLDVPEKTIRYWVYQREIPYYKIGRHIRFNSQEILKWVSERRIEHAY